MEYKSTKKGVLQVAVCMDKAMSALSRQTEVVLQAARCGGWLAYRPGKTGALELADTQLWAKCHPQVGGRVTAD